MPDCRKQAEVMEALQHSWKGYADYAWGMDELTPLTKAGASLFSQARGSPSESPNIPWLAAQSACSLPNMPRAQHAVLQSLHRTSNPLVLGVQVAGASTAVAKRAA